MEETLTEWIGCTVAVKTKYGDSFEGKLRILKHGLVFIDVDGKGKFICKVEDIILAVRLADVMMPKLVRPKTN